MNIEILTKLKQVAKMKNNALQNVCRITITHFLKLYDFLQWFYFVRKSNKIIVKKKGRKKETKLICKCISLIAGAELEKNRWFEIKLCL